MEIHNDKWGKILFKNIVCNRVRVQLYIYKNGKRTERNTSKSQ